MEPGGSNLRISRVDSDLRHKAAGRCLECRIQTYCSLWVKSISVTAASVGPADPGVVQWRNTIRSSSALYSGQAPNGASQGGSCNFVWDQMILVKHCRDGSGGSNLRISRDRLRFTAQGSWSLSRVSSSDAPLSLGEEHQWHSSLGWPSRSWTPPPLE